MAKVPRALGGYELQPAQQVDYFARIAFLNPTAGWLSFNQNGSAGLLGATLPEAGVAKVFAEDSPLLAAVSAPTGRSQACEGGFRVSGRWAYASGAHIAEWLVVTTLCDEPAGVRFVVLPRDAVQLHDDWHVAALQGTGSVDISADEVFVPEELSGTPFLQHRGGAQYVKLGYRGYVGGENVGFSLGVAQRMLEETTRLSRTKKRGLAPELLSERGAFQQELGRCDATLRAARAYVMTELERAMEIVEQSDAPLDEFETARLGGAIGWATEAICQSATRLFPYAGAGALHLDHPIQRSFRDLLGSGQHVIASNETLDDWGRALLQPEGEEA